MDLHDFCGFKWRGEHSSDHGIVRVSDGSRYNDAILPAFQDTTQKMPGSDGTLYWESFYTNKTFPINIAFDHLTEDDYRKLRQWLNGKDRGELIFDEAPYKAYTVKIKDPPQLKTICFMEDGKRIYKGEGTISFVAYYPFARGVYKIGDNIPEEIKNTEEWIKASGLESATQGITYNSFQLDEPGTAFSCNLYNAGDLPTDFKLIVNINYLANAKNTENTESTEDTTKTIILNETNSLSFLPLPIVPDGDTYVRFNSATQLIEGLKQSSDGKFELTGNLYNKYITKGDWFKIPVGESVIKITITPDPNNSISDNPRIDYDYLYY